MGKSLRDCPSLKEAGCAGRVGEASDPELGNSKTQGGSEGLSERVPSFLWVLTLLASNPSSHPLPRA